MTLSRQTVLLVDDDPLVRTLVGKTLKEQGFEVLAASSGDQGMSLIRKSAPDLVILDLELQGLCGLDILGAMKNDKDLRRIPIIILTGSDDGKQDVACLDSGADDYVIKTFEADKFMARVRAVLRRSHFGGDSSGMLRTKDMEIDTQRRAVIAQGRVIENFTLKEFDLLCLLATNSPKVLTRDFMAKKVWGDRQEVDNKRTIDVHIRRIRQKLGEPLHNCITTVPGQGYKFV